MFIESLVKATVELQGFRVLNVTGDRSGLAVGLGTDGRFSAHCGELVCTCSIPPAPSAL